jgi:hypothetical protein
MDKNTKILLGLAAASVVAYLIFKPKKQVVSQSTPTQVPIVVADHPNYSPNRQVVKTDVPTNIDAIKQLQLAKQLGLDSVDPCLQDPYSYYCAVSKGTGGIMAPLKEQV